MLASGSAPKTVRNVMTFVHSVFEEAIRLGWVSENPVRRAARPRRRRAGDANPDLQFLTLDQLERVIDAFPDQTVFRKPAPPDAAGAAVLRPRRPRMFSVRCSVYSSCWR
jgi:hypothetical protein